MAATFFDNTSDVRISHQFGGGGYTPRFSSITFRGDDFEINFDCVTGWLHGQIQFYRRLRQANSYELGRLNIMLKGRVLWTNKTHDCHSGLGTMEFYGTEPVTITDPRNGSQYRLRPDKRQVFHVVPKPKRRTRAGARSSLIS